MSIPYREVKITTVKELIMILLEYPENYRIFGSWEGIANPIIGIGIQDTNIYLNVDFE